MNTVELLTFINELKQHNNKEWMHEHKKEYQAAQQCFYDLLHASIPYRSEEHTSELQSR